MKKIFIAISILALFPAFDSFAAPNSVVKASRHDDRDDSDEKQGAYAYSTSTRKYGFAYGYDDVDSASERALSECDADDCEVVLLFKNCGALARGRRGAVGWAYARTIERAEAVALRECRKRGRGCEVVSSECND